MRWYFNPPEPLPPYIIVVRINGKYDIIPLDVNNKDKWVHSSNSRESG